MTQVGEPAHGTAPPRAGAPKPVKVWPVQIQSLQFTSDHHKMTDNMSDWTKSGTLLSKPEWRRQPRVRNPISHSRSKRAKAEATFKVLRQDAETKRGVARAKGPTKALRFKADRTTSFGPRTATSVPVTAEHDMPNLVGRLIASVQWDIEPKGRAQAAGVSGQHTIYVTYGDPIDTGIDEDGVTLRRMTKAIDWVGRAWASGIRGPVDLIDAVFSKFHGYILDFEMLPREQRVYLRKHPAELARLRDAGFAAYMNSSKGGAWPLAEWVRFGGECQAIVRLSRGIAHQIGLPGTIEDMYVSSEPGDPYTTRVLPYRHRPEGPIPGYGYALVDGPVVVGREYGARSGVGFNNYEAFLKYTDTGGKVTWFGGGIGRMPSTVKESDLVRVFWGLAAIESGSPDPASPGYVKSKIKKVWRYRPL